MFAIATLLWAAPQSEVVFQGSITAAHSKEAVRGARIKVKQIGATRLAADIESGSDGRFLAAVEPPPGEYRIDIIKANYTDVSLWARLPLTAPMDIRLTRLGSIAGRVTDVAGQPLGGAQVVPMIALEAGQFRPWRDGGRTVVDSTGKYRVHSLPPGRYGLAITWASMSGAEAQNRPTGAYLYPNNTHPLVFQITSGTSISGIDFTFPTQADYSISGRVIGVSNGAEYSVALILREQPSLAVVMKRTENDGIFRFDRVAPGSYELRAAGPSDGYAGWGATLTAKPRFGQRPVEVGGQNLTGVDVVLEAGRTVRVSLEAPPDCRGTTGATIWLEPLENWGALIYRTVQLPLERPIEVNHLAPVRYSAKVEKAPDGCYATGPVVVDARAGVPVRIAVARGGSVRGRVEGAATMVSLASVDDPAQVEQAAALDQGEFTFTGLRPGRYRLRAEDTSIEITVRANESTQVSLRVEERRP